MSEKLFTKEEMVKSNFEASMRTLKDIKEHIKPSPPTKEFIIKSTEWFKGINKHFEDGGIVPRIENHVIETNGKVAKNTKWRNYLFATIVIFSFLFPTLSGIFLYFISDMKSDMTNLITIEMQKNKIDYKKIDEYIDDNYLTE